MDLITMDIITTITGTIITIMDIIITIIMEDITIITEDIMEEDIITIVAIKDFRCDFHHNFIIIIQSTLKPKSRTIDDQHNQNLLYIFMITC